MEDAWSACGPPAPSAPADDCHGMPSEHDACSSDDCGGETGAPCPSGAATCCSTWGPPTERVALSAPISLKHTLDVAEILEGFVVQEDRAPEVAHFPLARAPGDPTDREFAHSLSRRGPPAIS